MSESLTQSEFDDHLYDGTLDLSLVGMSGIGKSYQSERLAREARFTRFCCDDMIAHELGFTGGMADLTEWMGQPSDPQFGGTMGTQATYLRHETRAIGVILDELDSSWRQGNTVVDATGSFAHIAQGIRDRVAARTTVVHIEATPTMEKEMFEKFMDEPKPVVWDGFYAPLGGETKQQTLERCYPLLLRHRSGLYAQMAHVTLSGEVVQGMDCAEEFLGQIRRSLPKKKR